MNISDLTSQKCQPCEGTEKPFTKEEYKTHLEILNGWTAIRDVQIEKEYVLSNFKEALEFVNKVGELAEQEGHHPDILLHGWKKVKIALSTHAIKGLSLNDFILAAKIDSL